MISRDLVMSHAALECVPKGGDKPSEDVVMNAPSTGAFQDTYLVSEHICQPSHSIFSWTVCGVPNKSWTRL